MFYMVSKLHVYTSCNLSIQTSKIYGQLCRVNVLLKINHCQAISAVVKFCRMCGHFSWCDLLVILIFMNFFSVNQNELFLHESLILIYICTCMRCFLQIKEQHTLPLHDKVLVIISSINQGKLQKVMMTMMVVLWRKQNMSCQLQVDFILTSTSNPQPSFCND